MYCKYHHKLYRSPSMIFTQVLLLQRSQRPVDGLIHFWSQIYKKKVLIIFDISSSCFPVTPEGSVLRDCRFVQHGHQRSGEEREEETSLALVRDAGQAETIRRASGTGEDQQPYNL